MTKENFQSQKILLQIALIVFIILCVKVCPSITTLSIHKIRWRNVWFSASISRYRYFVQDIKNQDRNSI